MQAELASEALTLRQWWRGSVERDLYQTGHRANFSVLMDFLGLENEPGSIGTPALRFSDDPDFE